MQKELMCGRAAQLTNEWKILHENCLLIRNYGMALPDRDNVVHCWSMREGPYKCATHCSVYKMIHFNIDVSVVRC